MKLVYDSSPITLDTRLLVSQVIDDEMNSKLVKGWKKDYGDLVDFGGGIQDVSCHQLMSLCEESPTTLRKKFPALTAAEAKRIVSGCAEAIGTEW